MRVLFVGANPSRKNSVASTAFAGTRSGKVLDTWISALGVTNYHLMNLIDEVKPKLNKSDLIKGASRIKEMSYEFDIIIALGNDAEAACNLAKITAIKLPHPSPSNRLLNNKREVTRLLTSTKLLILNIQGLISGTV